MSSLERVVERLVQVRTVECPSCKLEGRTVRVTVKKRKGKYCKTAKCSACDHRINVPFAEQYIDVKKVLVHGRTPKRLFVRPEIPPMPPSFEELRLVRRRE